MKERLSGAVTSLVILAACSVFPLGAFASETKSGSAAATIGGGSTALKGSLSADAKMGCTIAEAARLSLDSARGGCEPGNTIVGGQLAPSNDICGAPVKTTAQTSSQDQACSYSQTAPRCTLQGSTIDNAPNGTTDCSGFATGVLLRSGARILPNQPVQVPFTTADLISKIKSSSCWTKVTGSPKPGDMCVYNNGTVGHVWFVDRVDQNNGSNCTRIESTGGKKSGVSGPQINGAGGAVSDSMAGSTGCNAKETNQNVFCGRPTGTPECTDSAATNRRFKNEDKVMNCDVGGK